MDPAAHPKPAHMAPLADVVLDHQPIVPVVKVGAPLECKVDGFTHLKAYFDGWTHVSGRQKAFCHCDNHHPRCRLYVFVDDSPSTEHATYYLLAWASMWTRFPESNQRDDHAGFKPVVAQVSVIHREQFGA